MTTTSKMNLDTAKLLGVRSLGTKVGYKPSDVARSIGTAVGLKPQEPSKAGSGMNVDASRLLGVRSIGTAIGNKVGLKPGAAQA